MLKIVNDMKWAIVVTVAVIGLLGGTWAGLAQAQDVAKAAKSSVKLDKKEAPKEIAIPDTRTDKVLLLQEQGKNTQLELTALIEKFKAGEDYKKLEARQREVGDKLVAELTSALKLGGVVEADFGKYSYDQVTLKFTLKPEPEAAPVVKK